jgi:predicted metal-dependent hydrolase
MNTSIPNTACPGPRGIDRRSLLQVGGASLLGLSLPKMLQAEAATPAAARKDLLPRPGSFARSVLRYFRPGYHPAQEGSTQLAVAYLAASPAARAAAR